MSKFTPSVTFTKEFDGDKIAFTMRRLQRKHVMILAPYIRTDGEETKLSFAEQMQLMDAAAKILPEVIESMNGLTIQGAEATIEQITDEMYFAPLLGDLLAEAVSASSVRAADEKNSAAASSN